MVSKLPLLYMWLVYSNVKLLYNVISVVRLNGNFGLLSKCSVAFSEYCIVLRASMAL